MKNKAENVVRVTTLFFVQHYFMQHKKTLQKHRFTCT